MKGFRLAAASLTAAVLALGSSAFAQQGQAPAPVQQSEQVPVPQQPEQFGPAAVVINKLVTMQNSGKFPVTQEELDRATEFLMNKAKKEGVEVTRDEALVGMGYIAGSLATFMDIQKQAAEMVPQPMTPLPPEVMPAPVPDQQAQNAPQAAPQAEILVPVQPGQFQQPAPSAQNAPAGQQ